MKWNISNFLLHFGWDTIKHSEVKKDFDFHFWSQRKNKEVSVQDKIFSLQNITLLRYIFEHEPRSHSVVVYLVYGRIFISIFCLPPSCCAILQLLLSRHTWTNASYLYSFLIPTTITTHFSQYSLQIHHQLFSPIPSNHILYIILSWENICLKIFL